MLKECLEEVRKNHPLIHNITNYVTVNDVANVILASGASPIMADEMEEVEEITSICHGLVVNIGTLNTRTIESMIAAGKKAKELGHEVVLDPVGAGASALRTNTANRILKEVQPTIIRGNASEIKVLDKQGNSTSGVDANTGDLVSEETLEENAKRIQAFAKQKNCIVVVSGAIDIISDGEQVCFVRNGHERMRSVTGTGCQLSALIAAFVCANPNNRLMAVVSAVCLMGVVGEMAIEKNPTIGNASYRSAMINLIMQMDGDTFEKRGKYEIQS